MLHEIHAVRFFALPAVARLESQRKIGLQLLGQRLTAGRFRVEDLCAVVLALGEEVLVYAQKQRILRLVTVSVRFLMSETFFSEIVRQPSE